MLKDYRLNEPLVKKEDGHKVFMKRCQKLVGEWFIEIIQTQPTKCFRPQRVFLTATTCDCQLRQIDVFNKKLSKLQSIPKYQQHQRTNKSQADQSVVAENNGRPHATSKSQISRLTCIFKRAVVWWERPFLSKNESQNVCSEWTKLGQWDKSSDPRKT